MESKGGNMETINREQDIGYLVSFNGTILPIRPIRVKEKIGRNGVQYQAGELLYIHDQIIKYYILKGYIKNADHLLPLSRFELSCAVSDLGITVMIRAMHEFSLYLTDHITRKEYDAICQIQSKLNEPLKANARAHLEDDRYTVEEFPDFKTAVRVLKSRYQRIKGGKRK